MEKIGRYRVTRPLGHGGMGDVFLAHDPTLERDVALKLLHHEPTRSGLRDEAKALAALSHPGIVTIFEIGEHEGQDFIAMEYLPGRTLREVLRVRKATRPELLAICAKVAQAVEAAHAAGILHRDIKPENVVVADSGAIKVVDFGLARKMQHGDTRERRAVTATDVVAAFKRTLPPDMMFGGGADTEVSAGTQTMFGTPAYMAPEVLTGEPSTTASDVFSLGVTIYECITGHRPYPGTSLVEVIAQTIEGPPAKLDDPLGGIIERMLAPQPAQRPTLAEVARALMPAPTAPAIATPPRRARWPWLAAAVFVAAVIGVGSWAVARWRSPATPKAEPAFISASIAIVPFTIRMPGYGVEPPNAMAIADILARLLGEVQTSHLVGVTVASSDLAAARAFAARYLVRGTIEQRATNVAATIELVDTGTGAVVNTDQLEGPADQPARLLRSIADRIASHVTHDAHPIDMAPNTSRAQMFYRLGAKLLEAGQFTEARPYLEQAADADPQLFDAWYELELVYAWMDAPEPLTTGAYAQARTLAPPGPKAELIKGVGGFLHQDYEAARIALEPLEAIKGPTAPDRREVDYFLGETAWHDGRHADAFRYFEHALQMDPHFKPATVHAWQYAVTRRDIEKARYFVGLAGENTEWIELTLGNYEQLAATGSPPRKIEAQMVLGRLDTPEMAAKLAADDVDGASYRVAMAAAGGDLAGARTAFAQIWPKVIDVTDTTTLPGRLYALEGLGEVVIAAGMVDEARVIVTFLAQHSTTLPARGYHRLEILTAALTDEPVAAATYTKAPKRIRILAGAAVDHELARGLGEVIADPSFTFDFPERSLLLRELVRSKRAKEIAVLCADTLRPPIVRPAFLVVRAQCLKVAPKR